MLLEKLKGERHSDKGDLLEVIMGWYSASLSHVLSPLIHMQEVSTPLINKDLSSPKSSPPRYKW